MFRSFLKFQCHVQFVSKFHTQSSLYAGHSKWANIKHIKAQKDGEKAAVFTKLSRQIRLAIQEGGSPDPVLNSRLRSAVDEALRRNMPMATIQNNIKKSQQNKAVLKEYQLGWRYSKSQAKVFAICNIYTENFAAVKMDMAPVLKKAGASLLDTMHFFDEFGIINAKLDKFLVGKSPEEFEENATVVAIECGAEEVDVVDPAEGTVNFICRPNELNGVRKAIEEKGHQVDNTEHVFLPKNTVELAENEFKAYDTFLQKIRSVPGIEDVYDNVKRE